MTLSKDFLDQIKHTVNPANIYENEPLSDHTYAKIGGPADLLVQVNKRQELIDVYRLALRHNIPIFVLGSGSNIIVSDAGIRGLVIKNRSDQIKLANFHGDIKDKKVQVEQAVLEVDSGVITNHLVRHSIDQGLAGLQYFLGLPGTIGGAVYNNSHYKDQLIGDSIIEVGVIGSSGKIKAYSQKEMEFAYDYSILHHSHELVVYSKFLLKGGDKQKLWNQATEFAKQRAATQPLSMPSSGCMFKNISTAQAQQLDVSTKSAGYLIDKAGLKGTQVGKIQVSQIHANFFVNLGGGTATDLKKLLDLVQTNIKDKYRIALEPEVFFIGDQV